MQLPKMETCYQTTNVQILTGKCHQAPLGALSHEESLFLLCRVQEPESGPLGDNRKYHLELEFGWTRLKTAEGKASYHRTLAVKGSQ